MKEPAIGRRPNPPAGMGDGCRNLPGATQLGHGSLEVDAMPDPVDTTVGLAGAAERPNIFV
jgi:hypothetical protein